MLRTNSTLSSRFGISEISTSLWRVMFIITSNVTPENNTITTSTVSPTPSLPTPLTPIELIDLANQVLKLVHTLKDTVCSREYHQTLVHATAAKWLFPRIQLILYDMRTEAYSMQGQFESAIACAQQMISQWPTKAEGYFRKAEIFSIYGKMLEAIKTYDEGIRSASSLFSSTPAETKMSLSLERSKAVKINERRIDAFRTLPIEIIDNIVARLSQTTKLTCLAVSNAWCKKMKGCTDAWGFLHINNNRDDIFLLSFVPHIGYHIRHLEIDTPGPLASPLYLKYTRNGTFMKLSSLKMTSLATKDLQPHGGMFIIALWQTRHTLTSLDLDLAENLNNVTLADILSICSHLTELVFMTSMKRLDLYLGDFLMVEKHINLRSLQLKASSITEKDLKELLSHCTQLRRFVANGCVSSSLDTIYTCAKNLNILGFNPDISVPRLSTTKVDEIGNNKDGLRMFYTSNGPCNTTSALPILNIIHKNQASLETIHIAMTEFNELRFEEYTATYRPLVLKRLVNMTFRSEHNVQKFMLQSIQETRTLENLTVANVVDMEGLVNALINIPSSIKKIRNIGR
ncbi:hypothetical protein BDA99DRAFT_566145 [Phascolomyces articulosus]|uniref:F-box domain-containing protein n=1 Tax=Phascolomyces articulosus TaxID=60185 RepID=A0AAD5JXU7_9FUNG|nr:hypothetical protein BDA99DRAFT_566145 [Phascolomyces articulosus]